MTGLTAHDREWVDAIAALPIADTARAVLTLDAPAVEPLGVVAERIAATAWRAFSRSTQEWPDLPDARRDPWRRVAAAVLDALGTGAGQAAVDALESAADDFQHGGWLTAQRIGRAEGTTGVSTWLRRRADQLRAAVTSADDGDRDE